MKVNEIMSTNVLTVKNETTVEEIAHILVDNNISGVPVVDENHRVIGIITQKDILYKDVEPKFPAVFELLGGLVSLGGVRHYNEELKKLVATKAEDIMTKKVITINDDAAVEKAADMMVEKDLSRIPVIREGRLVGIVSRADVIKYIVNMMDSQS